MFFFFGKLKCNNVYSNFIEKGIGIFFFWKKYLLYIFCYIYICVFFVFLCWINVNDFVILINLFYICVISENVMKFLI